MAVINNQEIFEDIEALDAMLEDKKPVAMTENVRRDMYYINKMVEYDTQLRIFILLAYWVYLDQVVRRHEKLSDKEINQIFQKLVGSLSQHIDDNAVRAYLLVEATEIAKTLSQNLDL